MYIYIYDLEKSVGVFCGNFFVRSFLALFFSFPISQGALISFPLIFPQLVVNY